jgi:hypothetical protein
MLFAAGECLMRLFIILGSLLCSLALFGSFGCVDVRSFEGIWAGQIVSEPAVRQGFSETVHADPVELSNVDLQRLSAKLTLSDGSFSESPLFPVVKVENDALSSLTFDGRPLRTYLLFAPLTSEPDGWPAHVVISLFADDHVELRVFRGNDLFGVFHLDRTN